MYFLFISVILVGNFILTNDLQFLKVSPCISVISSCKLICSKDVQSSNVPPFITVTPLGIVILFKDLQFLKAPPPRYVRFSGKLISSNLESFSKSLSPNCIYTIW